MKQNRVEIPQPKVNVSLDHLSINLVSIDKVKIYANEASNLPWISGFLFLFLGTFLGVVVTKGFYLNDSITVILIIVSLIFAILTYRFYKNKNQAWDDVEKSKIDIKKSK